MNSKQEQIVESSQVNANSARLGYYKTALSYFEDSDNHNALATISRVVDFLKNNVRPEDRDCVYSFMKYDLHVPNLDDAIDVVPSKLYGPWSTILNNKITCKSNNLQECAFSNCKNLVGVKLIFDTVVDDDGIVKNGRVTVVDDNGQSYNKKAIYINGTIFENCNNLKDVTIDCGDNCVILGADVFVNCPNLNTIVLSGQYSSFPVSVDGDLIAKNSPNAHVIYSNVSGKVIRPRLSGMINLDDDDEEEEE